MNRSRSADEQLHSRLTFALAEMPTQKTLAAHHGVLMSHKRHDYIGIAQIS